MIMTDRNKDAGNVSLYVLPFVILLCKDTYLPVLHLPVAAAADYDSDDDGVDDDAVYLNK